VVTMGFKINNYAPNSLLNGNLPEDCYKKKDGFIFVPTINGKPYRIGENGEILITDVFSPYAAVSFYDKNTKKGAIGLTNNASSKKYLPENIVDTLLKEINPNDLNNLEVAIVGQNCNDFNDKRDSAKTINEILDKYGIKKIGKDTGELPVQFYGRMLKLDTKTGDVEVYRIGI
jgi:hypothetical protein